MKAKNKNKLKTEKEPIYITEVHTAGGEMAALYNECDDYNSNEAKKKRKTRKAWSLVGDVFFSIILCLLCYGTILVNLAKQKGQIPFLFGYSIEYVETGSMEPTLPTGAVILAREVNDSTLITEGDIITFYEGFDRDKEEPISRTVVTHRVYDISSNNGQVWYTTKGDNNNSPDQYKILFEDIIATFVRRLF